MEVVLWALGGLLGLFLVVLALIGFQHVTRGTPLRRIRGAGRGDGEGTPAVNESRFCEIIELLTDTVMKPGHAVELFTCGDEIYPRLWQDIRAAEKAVAVQMYYCKPGKVADEMKAALIDRAKAGVKVLFLHDAFGSQDLPDEYYAEMRAAGVECATFRPVRWYDLHKANARSHIRVVVVDGEVGWTGGFGLDDKWLGDGRHEDQWRDTAVRFTGPAVLQHMSTFADGWVEASGVLLTDETFFPPENWTGEGGVVAGAHHAAPTIGSTLAERFLALTIAGARRSLYITNSYFVPDDDFRRLLCEARKRGVDVRVLTPGEKTDTKTTWLAGRATYDELLSAGVRIYEYQPTMVHAKTIVADGCWSSIGTMNFDNRSLAFNDESNLLVHDEAIGQCLDAIFHEDLKYAEEIRLEEWRRRPKLAQVKEKAAQSLQRIL
jgi:cardiolipin synthase A/B